MATKQCPQCESRGGLNLMKGEVTQLMDAATKTPKLVTWTCGYCGYTDSDETHFTDKGGMYNPKS